MLDDDQLEVWQDGFDAGYQDGAEDVLEESDSDEESLWDCFCDWVG